MVLTRSELISSLQTEVRILLHLAGKIDRSMLDYRPTPGQRSTEELLRYLSMMGPALVRYALAEPPDVAIWTSAEQEAESRDFDSALAEIAAHSDVYAKLLGDVPDEAFRADFIDFEGKRTTLGAFLVDLVLCGCAAYRTQLFLYLKASGRHDLDSSNLWSGVDTVPA
jgi:hypothetical protein